MANKIVKSWLTKAGKDFRTAKALFELGEDFFENAAYHCQQCAEKSIKAFLAFHKHPFKKTHDIKFLLSLVASIDKDLVNKLEKTTRLTKYAIAARYPDAAEEIVITKSLVEEALKISRTAYEEVLSRIPQDKA